MKVRSFVKDTCLKKCRSVCDCGDFFTLDILANYVRTICYTSANESFDEDTETLIYITWRCNQMEQLISRRIKIACMFLLPSPVLTGNCI